MKRKRKLFTGVAPIGQRPIKSRRLARKVTSSFHDLTRKISTLENDLTLPVRERGSHIRALEDQVIAMGGRERYQEASIISTKHHKVIIVRTHN